MGFNSIRSLWLLLLCSPIAHAFTFTNGAVASCEDLDIHWTGGKPPYQLLMAPVFGTPRNITIPATAQGTFTIPQVPFPKGQRILLAMSDATGFGTGGTTPLITVGPSTGSVCNTVDPGVAFSYQLTQDLPQCKPVAFSDYKGAALPVSIMGLIPGGQAFTIGSATTLNFPWTVNVASGTPIVFVMTDSQGRQGGASDVRTISASSDATCLSSNSPTTTKKPTGTGKPSKTGTDAPSGTAGSGHAGIGAIAGTVIGGIIAIAVLVTLGLFFLKRRQAARPTQISPFGGNGNFRNSQPFSSNDSYRAQTNSQHYPYPVPHTAGSATTAGFTANPYSNYAPTESHYAPSAYDGSNPFNPPPGSNPNPFNPPPAGNPFNTPTQSTTNLNEQYAINPFTSNESHPSHTSSNSFDSPAARRKAAAAGETSRTTRYVQHSDLDELEADSDGIVELPPQYSDRRAPLNSLPMQDMSHRSPPGRPSVDEMSDRSPPRLPSLDHTHTSDPTPPRLPSLDISSSPPRLAPIQGLEDSGPPHLPPVEPQSRLPNPHDRHQSRSPSPTGLAYLSD